MSYNPSVVRAIPEVWNGRRYPSKGQARRARELHLLQRGGIISDLREEVTYKLSVNGIVVTTWRVDFVYTENGQTILEDWKSEGSAQKRDYQIKVRLARALGYTVRETGIKPKDAHGRKVDEIHKKSRITGYAGKSR